jgi:hypothetical protein
VRASEERFAKIFYLSREVLGGLKQLRPRMPVFILSMHAEEQYAVRAFRRWGRVHCGAWTSWLGGRHALLTKKVSEVLNRKPI